jgi:hypothetical protein
MKIREIFENTSTAAGDIAWVSQPMGMMSRSGGGPHLDKYKKIVQEPKRKKRARR